METDLPKYGGRLFRRPGTQPATFEQRLAAGQHFTSWLDFAVTGMSGGRSRHAPRLLVQIGSSP
jgi:hypothetical protein